MNVDKKFLIILALIIAMIAGGGILMAQNRSVEARLEKAMQELDEARTDKEIERVIKKIEKLSKNSGFDNFIGEYKEQPPSEAFGVIKKAK